MLELWSSPNVSRLWVALIGGQRIALFLAAWGFCFWSPGGHDCLKVGRGTKNSTFKGDVELW